MGYHGVQVGYRNGVQVGYDTWCTSNGVQMGYSWWGIALVNACQVGYRNGVEFLACLLLCLWLVINYRSLLVTVAGSNGGGDHPIPAVVRGYCCY